MDVMDVSEKRKGKTDCVDVDSKKIKPDNDSVIPSPDNDSVIPSSSDNGKTIDLQAAEKSFVADLSISQQKPGEKIKYEPLTLMVLDSESMDVMDVSEKRKGKTDCVEVDSKKIKPDNDSVMQSPDNDSVILSPDNDSVMPPPHNDLVMPSPDNDNDSVIPSSSGNGKTIDLQAAEKSFVADLSISQQKPGEKIKYEPLTPDQVRERVLFSPNILKKIFGCLELCDQNMFRLVCTDWCKLAHELWKPIVYDCKVLLLTKSLPEVLCEIEQRPLLKNIECAVQNRKSHEACVECILKNVEDLHSLEVARLIPEQGFQIAQKYNNLHSISVHVTSEGIASTIESLRSCEKLETLKLSFEQHFFSDKIDKKTLPAICTSISGAFPKLKHLVLNLNRDSSEGLPNLLREKSKTLMYLEIAFHEKVDSLVVNAVNTCAELRYLHLQIQSPDSSINLSNLAELQTLKLFFCGEYTEETVAATVNQLNASDKLEDFSLCLQDEKHNMGLVSKIVLKFPNLKKLFLQGIDGKQLDEQLVPLNTLRNLKFLQISTCPGASSEYMKYIKECPNLVTLHLLRCPINDSVLGHLENCRNLEGIAFYQCNIERKESLFHTLLTLRQLKYVFLIKSDISLGNERWIREQCELYGLKFQLLL